jgi:L-seryl-tRNA(Ser) seleniumtransferase
VPDVVASSGAILREVGTTNRTHLRDYEAAINERTALILKTHTSNYKVVGFTQEVTLAQLVELGRKHRVPVMYDLGSGYFSPEDGGFEEPDVAQTLAEGPDIVTFSCDKLLWGPQGGVVIGSKGYIDAIRKNPLWRVLRIGKLTASALGATLVNYLKKDAWSEGDMVWMLSRTAEQLGRLANRLGKQLG